MTVTITETTVIVKDDLSIDVVTVGIAGEAGVGVPTGGTTGQVLRKKSNTDYDMEFATIAGTGISDGDKGDITVSSSGAVWTIDNDAVTTAKIVDNAVTLDKIEDIATAHFIGRHSVGSGDPQQVSATQARSILNVADGADVTNTASVTAAGALMDSEVTNLAQVKSFDSSNYATAAQGALADSALQSADIGTSVQAYDADTAKTDVAQEYTAAQNFNATTLTDGATINWDLSANQVTSVTLGGNRTLAAPTNLKDGATYILTIKQDATGSRTLTFNSAYKFPGGTAPTLTTSANAVDVLTFVSDGTNMYGVSQLNFS